MELTLNAVFRTHRERYSLDSFCCLGNRKTLPDGVHCATLAYQTYSLAAED